MDNRRGEHKNTLFFKDICLMYKKMFKIPGYPEIQYRRPMHPYLGFDLALFRIQFGICFDTVWDYLEFGFGTIQDLVWHHFGFGFGFIWVLALFEIQFGIIQDLIWHYLGFGLALIRIWFGTIWDFVCHYLRFGFGFTPPPPPPYLRFGLALFGTSS